jgi:hypothetical protein
MLMLKKPGGDWKWCSIGQWQWYMTKWVLAPFFPFILLFVKIGSLFNNGEEWQKLDQALTMIGNDIVRFCQLVLQLYVIFTKVVTLKVFQKCMIACKLELFSFRLNIFLYSRLLQNIIFFEPTF